MGRLHSLIEHHIHYILRGCSGIHEVHDRLLDKLGMYCVVADLLLVVTQSLVLLEVDTFYGDNNTAEFWSAESIASVSGVDLESCMCIELHVLTSLWTC